MSAADAVLDRPQWSVRPVSTRLLRSELSLVFAGDATR